MVEQRVAASWGHFENAFPARRAYNLGRTSPSLLPPQRLELYSKILGRCSLVRHCCPFSSFLDNRHKNHTCPRQNTDHCTSLPTWLVLIHATSSSPRQNPEHPIYKKVTSSSNPINWLSIAAGCRCKASEITPKAGPLGSIAA